MKKKDEYLEILRHSASHVMADAVRSLWPGVKLGIGPAIEEGFYYDFDFSACAKKEREKGGAFLTPEDLPAIEKKMRGIIKENLPFKKEIVTREEALKIFSVENQTFKTELVNELKEGEEISLYRHGDFVDLCRGPHVASTGEIKAFKLVSVAGAYWKGDESNIMLQRVYGTAFPKEGELKEHLRLREEARKRDHRKLGTQLDLYSFNEEIGAGLVLYHHKGALLRQIIADYITKKHLEKAYQLVSSPHILKSDIWIQSGHYDYYKEHMYIFKTENQEYAVKPMNCPGHILVYSSRLRSYKDLPIRYFELGNVYRHEKSGVLHGLLRVRGFTQDDAHIFCRQDQAVSEIIGVMDFVEETLKVFGFSEFEIELSTRPEEFIGTEKDWELATEALKKALDEKKLSYDINEGDGAFYGPKIDIKLKDALGRSWQCATIQCDFALPERFNLRYTDERGSQVRPIMLHRVILGSLERFIGALVEHYGGAFPLWLAPVQVEIIPISRAHCEYAKKVEMILKAKDFRAETDTRNEKMQKKIREAEMEKVPYMVVAGNKEMETEMVSVRARNERDMGAMALADFIEFLEKQKRG